MSWNSHYTEGTSNEIGGEMLPLSQQHDTVKKPTVLASSEKV